MLDNTQPVLANGRHYVELQLLTSYFARCSVTKLQLASWLEK